MTELRHGTLMDSLFSLMISARDNKEAGSGRDGQGSGEGVLL